MPVYSHKNYAWWVITQLRGEDLKVTPGEMVRRHAAGWRDVFAGIVAASAVLELPALVVSRWEYLGSLHRGNVSDQTNAVDAIAFADRFLVPVNPQYQLVHNVAGRATNNPNQSDFYMMLRNKTLHGANPAAIHATDGSGVVAWWIGPHDTGATHLAVDADGKLNVNGTALYEELLAAMRLYADYLDANTEQGGPGALSQHLPQERWLRAAWARFKPHGQAWAEWLVHGQSYGVPP
jgi:hypothetical protein